jgi:hypothetical protein
MIESDNLTNYSFTAGSGLSLNTHSWEITIQNNSMNCAESFFVPQPSFIGDAFDVKIEYGIKDPNGNIVISEFINRIDIESQTDFEIIDRIYGPGTITYDNNLDSGSFLCSSTGSSRSAIIENELILDNSSYCIEGFTGN